MLEVEETIEYGTWFAGLKDLRARARIDARIAQIKLHGELFGDCKPVGERVTELRFDFGPGYRVYVTLEGRKLMLLLSGGDKSSQASDIRKAKKLACEWRSERGYEN